MKQKRERKESTSDEEVPSPSQGVAHLQVGPWLGPFVRVGRGNVANGTRGAMVK